MGGPGSSVEGLVEKVDIGGLELEEADVGGMLFIFGVEDSRREA
jgi:hypothetical protein